ncbi:cytochrome P450 [Streptomyces sp. ME03-5709C]|nr:cytochrome P450 [Streptomyces sp. ME03-5709C]
MRTVPRPGSAELTRRCPFDPPREFELLRDDREAGVLHRAGDRTYWLFTSHSAVTTVLGDGRFSSRVNTGPRLPSGAPLPAWFFGMDAPEHTRYRRLLAGYFTLRSMRAFAPRIEAIVDEHLTAMRHQGPPADLFTDFAWPVPARVIGDLIGLDERQQRLLQDGLQASEDEAAPAQARKAAFDEVWDMLTGLVEDRRRDPQDDLLSHLVRVDAALPTDEVASMALAVAMAGHAPVAHVLAMGAYWLLREGRALVADVKDPRHVERAVDEIIRYMPTNNLGVVRRVTEDVELEGESLRRGDVVFVSLPTANRDPARFDRADTLDLDRGFTPHVAFGHGLHLCVGHNLARVQLGIGFTALFRAFPDLRLAGDGAGVTMLEDDCSYGVAKLSVSWQERSTTC